MGLYCRIKEKTEYPILIGHRPRELPSFCKFYLECNGEPDATVRSTKFRRSLLSQGGPEIPINIYMREGKANEKIYTQMQEFVSENYMEPEKKFRLI